MTANPPSPGRAVVVLEEVDAPRGVRLRVLRLVAEAAHAPTASEQPPYRPWQVPVLADRRCRTSAPCRARSSRARPFPTGNLVVSHLQLAGGIAAVHPAVVDVDVLIAGVLHSAGDQGIGRRLMCALIDALERVPRVPAHRRRRRKDRARRVSSVSPVSVGVHRRARIGAVDGCVHRRATRTRSARAGAVPRPSHRRR